MQQLEKIFNRVACLFDNPEQRASLEFSIMEGDDDPPSIRMAQGNMTATLMVGHEPRVQEHAN